MAVRDKADIVRLVQDEVENQNNAVTNCQNDYTGTFATTIYTKKPLQRASFAGYQYARISVTQCACIVQRISYNIFFVFSSQNFITPKVYKHNFTPF